MKYLVIAISGIATLIAITVGVLQIDDPLNATAQQWIELSDANLGKESQAYYFLMGIDAMEGADPLAIGKSRVAAANATRSHGRHVDLNKPETPPENRLPLPQGDLYCRPSEANCFNRLTNHPSNLSDELKQYNTLLNRYRRFFSYHDYKTLTKPSINTEVPDFRYLVKANKLFQFTILLAIADTREASALNTLNHDMEALRQQLASADTLIHKIVLVNLLADDIDLWVELYNGGSIEHATAITPLTAEQHSLYLPMIREFAVIADTYRTLDKSPQFFDKDGHANPWLVRILFKPNMSINEIVSRYFIPYTLSVKTASEFALLNRNANEDTDPGFSLRNYVGSVLNNVSRPDFDKYPAILYDLDCKIKLLNIRLSWGRDHKFNDETLTNSNLDLSNPYYPEQKPYIDKALHKLCYTGPYEDSKGLRCIAI